MYLKLWEWRSSIICRGSCRWCFSSYCVVFAWFHCHGHCTQMGGSTTNYWRTGVRNSEFASSPGQNVHMTTMVFEDVEGGSLSKSTRQLWHVRRFAFCGVLPLLLSCWYWSSIDFLSVDIVVPLLSWINCYVVFMSKICFSSLTWPNYWCHYYPAVINILLSSF